LTPHQFALLFEPSVRVLLDWRAIDGSDSPVEVQVAASTDDLDGWYFPWHVGQDGDETRFDDPGARPLRILDWPQPGFTGHRKAVDAMAASLRAFPGPVQLIVAAYALPQEGRVALDGNHRLAAIVQEGLSFRALVVTLYGPLDDAILPDLRYWAC